MKKVKYNTSKNLFESGTCYSNGILKMKQINFEGVLPSKYFIIDAWNSDYVEVVPVESELEWYNSITLQFFLYKNHKIPYSLKICNNKASITPEIECPITYEMASCLSLYYYYFSN